MKLIALTILLLAACGTTDTTEDPTAVCGTDFAANAIDSATWNVYQQPPSTIAQRDGQLVINIPAGAAAYSTLYSQRVGFGGASVAAELGEVQRADGADSIVQLAVADQQRHFMAVEDGRLYMGTQVDDRFDTVDMPFDAVAHKFLRLATAVIDGRVLYQTSPDGATWTAQYDSRLVLPLDQAYFELGAGAYKPVSSPGVATFKSTVVEGACAP